MNGMGCALNACYATTPSTYLLTKTSTASADGQASTITTTEATVVTPTRPTGLPSTDPGAVFKFIPVTQAKVPVSPTPSSDSGGLTQPQIGGIVGGAIGLLVVVLAASFVIVRKLHLTAKMVESSSSANGGRLSKPMAQRHRPSGSQVEYDDLLQGPAHRSRAASELSSSNTTPFLSSASDPRNASMEGGRGGYFDVPTRGNNMPGRHSVSTDQRTSVDSQQYQQHGRHYSGSSLQSDGSATGGLGSPLLPAELGNEGSLVPELPSNQPLEQARRRSGSAASPGSPTSRPPLTHVRGRSDGHSRDRNGSSAGGQQLDVVSESAEHLHGHYGPLNSVAGQTRAGMGFEHDIRSAIASPHTPPHPQGTPPS